MTNKQQSTFKYIFGPVPSRRLGRSLGVDLVPHKTCTLNCVYCECGKTTHLTLQRDEFVPATELKNELSTFLSNNPKLDFITFSGAGEPSLNSSIGEIIRFIATKYPQYKVALLTNGTLLYQPAVREQLLEADLVIASLDAASKEGFHRVNRPHPKLNLSEIIDGLVSFKQQFNNTFWIEIFILPDVNDSSNELKQLKNALAAINPDKIQLNTLDRPGTESWVKPADASELADIAEYLFHAEIVKYNRPHGSDRNNQIRMKDITQSLLSTIKRRPCTAQDISQVLGLNLRVVNKHLLTLVEKGQIGKYNMERGIFYAAKP